MTEEELYQIELAELKKLNEKRTDARHSFGRYVVSLAAGSLVIITSFHKTSNDCPCSQYFYMASLSLIALGILFLALSLYGDTVVLHLAAEGNWEYLQKRYFQKDKTALPYMKDKPDEYKWCERIGFSCLLLAVVSFLMLAILAY